METYEEQILAGFAEELTSCPQEYPASQRVLPGSEEARMMSVGSGRQCSMLLSESEPLGYCSKILLESLHWTSSQEYCYVWERLDTRFALSAFQLTPLGQSTDERGSSLLGTPNAKEAGPNGQVGCLRQTIEMKLWRTPNASDVTGGPMDGERRLEQGHHLNLQEQAATPKLWPPPPLSEVAGLHGSGSLNPRFVEELMGFPIDHTALKPSVTP
jgi:hypothetical protein